MRQQLEQILVYGTLGFLLGCHLGLGKIIPLWAAVSLGTVFSLLLIGACCKDWESKIWQCWLWVFFSAAALLLAAVLCVRRSWKSVRLQVSRCWCMVRRNRAVLKTGPKAPAWYWCAMRYRPNLSQQILRCCQQLLQTASTQLLPQPTGQRLL